MNRIKRKISNHLLNAKKNYFEHLGGAMRTCRECFLAGLAALIHGFVPFLFETTASDIVRTVYKRQNR